MIPDFQKIMLPLLEFCTDGRPHSPNDLVAHISHKFNLNEEEKLQRIPSGTVTTISNRVGWALTYLKRAGLLESPRRSEYHITRRGIDLLSKKPAAINISVLKQFPEFLQFRTKRSSSETVSEKEEINTPDEDLRRGYLQIRAALAEELLTRIKLGSPQFFEKLVVDLLLKMGYGDPTDKSNRPIGQSGDGGIDGIINEDKLGLDVIYIQAKKWDNPVPAAELRDFLGALQLKGAKKGVFITTSNFPKNSSENLKVSDRKIVLIDGSRLADLMIDYGVGVETKEKFEIKQIDSDYFDED